MWCYVKSQGRPAKSRQRPPIIFACIFIVALRYKIYIVCGMKFEFDQKKNVDNLRKHKIDFLDIQALWEDSDLFEIPAKTVEDEGRCLVIGKIGNKHWSAVITYRDDFIRIISARRAREKEVQYYES